MSELTASPNPAIVGTPVRLTFTCPTEVRAWQADLSEDPPGGGSLSSAEGKALAAGEALTLTYCAERPTTATITVSAASAAGALVMRSVTVRIKAQATGLAAKLGRIFSRNA